MRPGRSGLNHSGNVHAWLASAQKGLSSQDLIDLFGLGLDSVWTSAEKIISDVTLIAVFDRVAAYGQALYPWVPMIPLKANRPDLASMRAAAASIDRKETLMLIQILLTEYVSILGAMTGETLTPRMHRALKTVRFVQKR